MRISDWSSDVCSSDLIGVVHLLHRDQFDIGGNSVFGAEIEHLLGFGDAANGRTGNAAPPPDKRPRSRRDMPFGTGPYKNESPVAFQQAAVEVKVLRSRDCADDQVEAAPVFRHPGFIA